MSIKINWSRERKVDSFSVAGLVESVLLFELVDQIVERYFNLE